MSRPSPGSMVMWRFIGNGKPFKFGYCTYLNGHEDLIRLGNWNGDTTGGSIVSAYEIEWRPWND